MSSTESYSNVDLTHRPTKQLVWITSQSYFCVYSINFISIIVDLGKRRCIKYNYLSNQLRFCKASSQSLIPDEVSFEVLLVVHL